MTQRDLNRAVARATGETQRTIACLGFGMADPRRVAYDPEPCDPQEKCLDWDDLARSRYALTT